MPTKKPAVILVSGGLDSCTILAIAKSEGFDCYALSFDYGQRNRAELVAAANVAQQYGAREHRILKLDIGQLGGSALTDDNIDIPVDPEDEIPVTYVPARNTVFLSCALAWAEVLEASDIFIGVNAVDYSGYPDCRPEFIQAFEQLAQLATRIGVEGSKLQIHTPLMKMSKKEIIETGLRLGVDYSMTLSCYQPDNQGKACGKCDACKFRAEGFNAAGETDPTHYQQCL
jgi:7-cyano-7-deazaguanine synthase